MVAQGFDSQVSTTAQINLTELQTELQTALKLSSMSSEGSSKSESNTPTSPGSNSQHSFSEASGSSLPTTPQKGPQLPPFTIPPLFPSPVNVELEDICNPGNQAVQSPVPNKIAAAPQIPAFMLPAPTPSPVPAPVPVPAPLTSALPTQQGQGDLAQNQMAVAINLAALGMSTMDPRKYKTKLCRNWMKTGQCSYSASCCFAHGEDELRDPTANIQAILRGDLQPQQSQPQPQPQAQPQPQQTGYTQVVLLPNGFEGAIQNNGQLQQQVQQQVLVQPGQVAQNHQQTVLQMQLLQQQQAQQQAQQQQLLQLQQLQMQVLQPQAEQPRHPYQNLLELHNQV